MKKFIFLSLILLFLTKTQNVFASTNTFTVDNIEVSGEIRKDIPRERYLNIAFRKGFQSLIQNILKKEDHKKLSSTNLKTIKSLIENYRVLEEKTTDSQYTLNIEITFSRNLLNVFFSKNNISYSEVTKLDIIVYPILIINSELQLFSENDFLKEWNDSKDIENIDFILPVDNMDDINFIKNNILILEESNLEKLVDKYEIKNTSILILRHNNKKLNVFLKTNFKGSKKTKRYDFKIQDIDDMEKRALIIKDLKFHINDLWKEQNLIDISVPSYLTVNVRIENQSTLVNVMKRLGRINLIENYNVEILDKNYAKIKIKYFGKIKNLKDSFINNGFKFKVLHNEWNLSLNI